MRYAVIGTGAIGGFYGAKLASAGKEVHFLFRSDYSQVVQNGLVVESVDANFTIDPVNAYRTTDDMPPCDVVLVGLKTTANHMLDRLLRPILKPNTLVVLIQNGYGIEQQLAEVFPEISIAGGMAFICSQKNSPGVISHLDYGSVNIGLYCGNRSGLEQVVDDFTQSGVDARIVPDLMKARWEKLVWNVPFNGMSVVMNALTEEMVKNESTRELLYDIMVEVITAAKYCGVDIDADFPDKMMAMTMKMTAYAPSMKLDYDHRRPMEINTMYSAPIMAAAAVGYDMKKTKMLEQQLRFISAQYLK